MVEVGFVQMDWVLPWGGGGSVRGSWALGWGCVGGLMGQEQALQHSSRLINHGVSCKCVWG